MTTFNGEDYEFAAGAIKGLRSWEADDQGRLRGVTHKAVWLPGENVSVCKDPGGTYEPCPSQSRETDDDDLYFNYKSSCGDPTCIPYQGHFVAATETHTFDAEHTCGFWAYDEYNFQHHGNVVGVIEGYGKATVGTKGFRCEKARIVALCREHEKGDLSLSLWLRLQQLYPAAKFYDDFDDMVTANGAVLRASWDTPDEDFWSAPDIKREDDMYSALTASYRRLSQAFTTSISTVPLTYNPPLYPRSLKRRRFGGTP